MNRTLKALGRRKSDSLARWIVALAVTVLGVAAATVYLGAHSGSHSAIIFRRAVRPCKTDQLSGS